MSDKVTYWAAESQKPRQRVSNADRKVFANPESFCKKFIVALIILSFWMIWKVSG